MVFRKEKGTDAFHRQFSALRHQLGGQADEQGEGDEREDPSSIAHADAMTPEPEDRHRYRDPEPYREEQAEVQAMTDRGLTTSYLDTSTETPDVLAAPNTQTSIIAHDTVWQGDLRTNGSLHVHGVVQGSLEASDSIFIADEADVDATITAQHVIVSGFVKGSIRCSRRFEALAAGRILADVLAPSIVIHEGAVIQGAFRMEKHPSSDEKSPSSYRRAARNR
ncbi:MAG TPA: polymer-forming cytoskeletal protein [Thermomicrobiales bacterium]|nr:polymer-forming cytoskeletal protein [Thermomicrobiales bacterium]